MGKYVAQEAVDKLALAEIGSLVDNDRPITSSTPLAITLRGWGRLAKQRVLSSSSTVIPDIRSLNLSIRRWQSCDIRMMLVMHRATHKTLVST